MRTHEAVLEEADDARPGDGAELAAVLPPHQPPVEELADDADGPDAAPLVPDGRRQPPRLRTHNRDAVKHRHSGQQGKTIGANPVSSGQEDRFQILVRPKEFFWIIVQLTGATTLAQKPAYNPAGLQQKLSSDTTSAPIGQCLISFQKISKLLVSSKR